MGVRVAAQGVTGVIVDMCVGRGPKEGLVSTGGGVCLLNLHRRKKGFCSMLAFLVGGEALVRVCVSFLGLP